MHEVVTPETEMHDVQIFKNNSELGITVAGYVCDKVLEEISGIFVKDISIGSAADLTGNIKINDRIVKVNGKSLTTLTNQEAIKLLKNSGPIVLISLERYPQSAKSYDIQSDTIYSPVSAECFISALSNDVVDPKFEEKMHLSLLTEVSEEQEKQSKMNSLTEEENDNNPMPFSTNIKEYTIQTDLDKNTIKEIPLDVPSNTLNDNNKPPTQELQIATKMADSSVNSDSSCIYFSDDTERDEYETCMDDSFSEENFNTKLDKSPSFEDTQSDVCNYNFVNNYVDTVSSEPCLNMRDKLQSWKSKDANLKSFDSDLTETDEFFLVQCINENVAQKPVAYKCIKLEEYYNDYEDCIESYKESFRKLILETEEDLSMESKYLEDACGRVAQDECLPSKSSSAPHLLESYQEECYGCPKDFRKPSLPGFLNNVRNSEEEAEEEEEEMTVTAKQQNFDGSSENVLKKHWGVNKRIEVYREPNGSVGISIVCGKVDLHNLETSFGTISGIFIKSVVPNSAAGRTGQFQTGDRIIKVGDIDLTNATQEEALNAIRSSTDPISFIVQPILPLNDLCVSEKDSIEPEVDKILDKEVLAEERATENEIDVGQEKQEDEDESEKLKVEEKPQEVEEPQPLLAEPQPPLPQPQPPSIKYDDEEDEEDDYDDEEEDQRELSGRTVSKLGKQIDRASAGNLRRSPEDIAADPEQEDEYGYTTNKIRKKYAQLGNTVMMVQIERGQQGLGLSLAGHKDRNCMAVFVCGLNPNGIAYKTGGIQVGDEILEVNGVVLYGRCHLNASAIIKGLSGPIFKIIILRRKAAVNDIAVRPLSHFPVLLEEETAEDKFNGYPNVRQVSIKKGNHSLGIMIIEGKHADLGQGIFISDIQDGSSAEKSGLEVGEMILAVNKDSLLGANYDTAATLLKRTEGVVNLVLSNPAKKSDTSTIRDKEIVDNKVEQKPATVLKVSAPPSRAATPLPEVSVDPTTCSVIPGKNSTIEMLTNNQALGLFIIGGKDTLISEGIIVIEVFSGGAVEKDGRIQPGDHIIDVNGTSLKDASNETALQTLRQLLPKMKLVIYRPEKIEYITVEADLIKKPGKGLGLSIIGRKAGQGAYVSEILNGGNADINGKITKGDLLMSVNGQNAENLSAEEAGVLLKTVSGRAVLKFNRYKATVR